MRACAASTDSTVLGCSTHLDLYPRHRIRTTFARAHGCAHICVRVLHPCRHPPVMATALPPTWRGWYRRHAAGLYACVAYGAALAASSAMNNLFATYYIHLFTSASSLTPTAFYVGQSVFMVWNAVNDPLFGWLSDNILPASAAHSPLARRTRAVRWGGTAWAVAFCAIWWPASSTVGAAIHFVLSLCAYDGLLTYVEVNHAALLAEMTSSTTGRAYANMASAIGAGIGSLTSFVAYHTYDARDAAARGGAPPDLTRFRTVVLFIALVAILLFHASAWGVERYRWPDDDAPHAHKREQTEAVEDAPFIPRRTEELQLHAAVDDGTLTTATHAAHAAPGMVHRPERGGQDVHHADVRTSSAVAPLPSVLGKRTVESSSDGGSASAKGYLNFVSQLLRSRNFVAFVLISTIQVFDCTFEKNFFAPFMEVLTLSPPPNVR
ncbi:hypothetical protein EON67_03100, partial [archaeon]